jgi:hypothetical protein
MTSLTAVALAAIVLGVVGLLLLASAAPWPLTLAAAAIFTLLYLNGSSRR